jgi:hypothetical protein
MVEYIDSNMRKAEFTFELKDMIVHEETHRQQNQSRNAEQDYISDFNPKSWEERKRYLSQYVEIDAIARMVAYEAEMIFYQLKDTDILKLFASLAPELQKLSFKAQNIIKDYHNVGGDVWRKFLSEVYRYFTEIPTLPEIK